jgi:hypothetical protein
MKTICVSRKPGPGETIGPILCTNGLPHRGASVRVVSTDGAGVCVAHVVSVDRAGGTYSVQVAGAPTRREAEALALLARGLKRREIGAAMGVSVNTVGQHLDSVYKKLDGKAGALAWVRRDGR